MTFRDPNHWSGDQTNLCNSWVWARDHIVKEKKQAKNYCIILHKVATER